MARTRPVVGALLGALLAGCAAAQSEVPRTHSYLDGGPALGPGPGAGGGFTPAPGGGHLDARGIRERSVAPPPAGQDWIGPEEGDASDWNSNDQPPPPAPPVWEPELDEGSCDFEPVPCEPEEPTVPRREVL